MSVIVGETSGETLVAFRIDAAPVVALHVHQHAAHVVKSELTLVVQLELESDGAVSVTVRSVCGHIVASVAVQQVGGISGRVDRIVTQGVHAVIERIDGPVVVHLRIALEIHQRIGRQSRCDELEILFDTQRGVQRIQVRLVIAAYHVGKRIGIKRASRIDGISEAHMQIAFLSRKHGRKHYGIRIQGFRKDAACTSVRSFVVSDLGIHVQAELGGRSHLYRDVALEIVCHVVDVAVP